MEWIPGLKMIADLFSRMVFAASSSGPHDTARDCVHPPTWEGHTDTGRSSIRTDALPIAKFWVSYCGLKVPGVEGSYLIIFIF